MTMTRRQLLRRMGAVTMGAALSKKASALEAQGGTAELRVNADRLRQTLVDLSFYGRPSGGTFEDGVSRVAYSDADVAGRKYAMELLRGIGLEPHVDTAANVFALRAGTDSSLKPILSGSHIDSVPNGGNFDGDVGSMAAIEVLHTLHEHEIATRHPLQIAIWSNEEGGLIGSSAAAGELRPEDLRRQFNGVTAADGIRKLGGDPARLAEARLTPGAFRCYLELHIEQGANLYKANVPIGVVEGIVSIDDYEVDIHGFANHAGTTPMNERHDALLAAANLIEAVQDAVTSEAGRQVGTVGRLQVYPNAVNVIPGEVKHSLELRDLSAEKIARLGAAIQKRAQQIAKDTGTEIVIKKVQHDPPAVANPEIQSNIAAAAAGLALKTMRLPSGAGHDAQMMARLVPMGMIFVPSVDGISHSPKELTRWQDCANGANVLLQTILRIDRAA